MVMKAQGGNMKMPKIIICKYSVMCKDWKKKCIECCNCKNDLSVGEKSYYNIKEQ